MNPLHRRPLRRLRNPPRTPKLAAKPKAPDPPRAPSPPPEDPTKKALASMAAATAREIDEAQQADRRTESLEKARRDAVAQSERWRRRELLVKQQVAALADRARKIDRQIDTLAAERDVLAQERDALKAAVAKSQQGKGSFAVLPYKGANGSWRRPIVLECSQRDGDPAAQGPDLLVARSLVDDQPSVQSGHPGHCPRAAPRADVRVSRRVSGGPLFRLPRASRRHSPLLRDPRPPRAAGHRFRLRAGRAGAADRRAGLR